VRATDPATLPPAGGHPFMRERVLIHGGEFDVVPGPDGTRVRMRLPLTPLETT